jgi:hypothetical protein
MRAFPHLPMKFGVMATSEAYYLRQTFMEMVRVLDRSDKTVKDYWCSFDILKGINNIDTAWEDVSVNCVNGVWCKLLPEYMQS